MVPVQAPQGTSEATNNLTFLNYQLSAFRNGGLRLSLEGRTVEADVCFNIG